VSDLKTAELCRKPLHDHRDYRSVPDVARNGADATVLPGVHGAEVFDLIFGDVVRIRIQRFQHSVDAGADERVRIDVVDVEGIHFTKQRREDVEIAGDLEIPVGRVCECEYDEEPRYDPYCCYPLFHNNFQRPQTTRAFRKSPQDTRILPAFRG